MAVDDAGEFSGSDGRPIHGAVKRESSRVDELNQPTKSIYWLVTCTDLCASSHGGEVLSTFGVVIPRNLRARIGGFQVVVGCHLGPLEHTRP